MALEMSSIHVFAKLRRESLLGGGGDCNRQQRGVGGLQESIAMLVERSLSLDWDIQVQVLRSSTLVGKTHLLGSQLRSQQELPFWVQSHQGSSRI